MKVSIIQCADSDYSHLHVLNIEILHGCHVYVLVVMSPCPFTLSNFNNFGECSTVVGFQQEQSLETSLLLFVA